MSAQPDRSIFLQLLETTAGQEVGSTFFATLFSTWDLLKALDDAGATANRNGTLLPLQIAILIDGLRFIGELANRNRPR